MKPQIYKLDIDDFGEIDYDLIAINTIIEDYLLAFRINESLKLELSRYKADIISTNNLGEVAFSRYRFEDVNQQIYWSLVQNQKWIETFEEKLSLFEQTQQKVYLLPEFKNADYFLKIEGAEFESAEIQGIISQIKKINNVSAVFTVDVEQIKSKNNLIF